MNESYIQFLPYLGDTQFFSNLNKTRCQIPEVTYKLKILLKEVKHQIRRKRLAISGVGMNGTLRDEGIWGPC